MSPSPIIILHGWGQDITHWKDFTSRCSDREIILFNLPGFGNEPLVSDRWGVPDYAAWVEKKITETVTGEAVLLGHSFGGRIAALIASRRPSWLRGLILYGAPVLYRPDVSVRARIALAKTMKGIVPSGLRAARVTTDLQDAERTGLGQVFRRVVPFDETTALPNISVPTLLVWGEKDTSVPLRIATEAATLIQGSSLVVMPGVGHNAHLENPELFYGVVKRFLET